MMSTYQNPHDHDLPRFEPWLGVLASAFLPPIVALYLPQFLIPLFAIMGILVAVGLTMLRRQSVRRARERSAARLQPSGD